MPISVRHGEAPLEALANGISGGNGVYLYGAGGFPTNSFNSANYWVDVVFATSITGDTTPPTVVSVAPTAGATGVAPSSTVAGTFSENVSNVTTTTFELRDAANALVPAAVSYSAATRTATLTPNTALAYSTTYTARLKGGTGGIVDAGGNPLAADYTWTFTTTAAPNCPCTVWPASTVPAIITVNDSSAIELGVKFRSTIDGFITGIRFYKGPQNTGVHVGNLWTSTGTLLSTATFSGETASGWQQVTLPQPVAVNANTVYVASYHTTTGFYSADGAYFAASTVSGPLEALANGASAGNGVYLPGAGGFPTDTFNSTNYWVDVVFVQTAPAPPPSLTIADASVVEGNAGIANAVFNVSLSAPGSGPITVDFATSGGTATAGTDYTTTAGQLSFAPGITTATITVPVTGDTDQRGQ